MVSGRTRTTPRHTAHSVNEEDLATMTPAPPPHGSHSARSEADATSTGRVRVPGALTSYPNLTAQKKNIVWDRKWGRHPECDIRLIAGVRLGHQTPSSS